MLAELIDPHLLTSRPDCPSAVSLVSQCRLQTGTVGKLQGHDAVVLEPNVSDAAFPRYRDVAAELLYVKSMYLLLDTPRECSTKL